MFPADRLGGAGRAGGSVAALRAHRGPERSPTAGGPSPSLLPATGFRVQKLGLCVRHGSPCGSARGLPGGGCREPSGRSAELAAVASLYGEGGHR